MSPQGPFCCSSGKICFSSFPLSLMLIYLISWKSKVLNCFFLSLFLYFLFLFIFLSHNRIVFLLWLFHIIWHYFLNSVFIIVLLKSHWGSFFFFFFNDFLFLKGVPPYIFKNWYLKSQIPMVTEYVMSCLFMGYWYFNMKPLYHSFMY